MKQAPGQVTATRRLEWDSMHRQPGHEGKCRAYHGHRYVAELTCAAPSLDQVGRVIDFGKIKELVGTWIDDNWDHTAILMRGDPDPATQAIVAANERVGRPAYLMEGPPSAENIAIELATIASDLLKSVEIQLISARVWETPNCFATWEAPSNSR